VLQCNLASKHREVDLQAFDQTAGVHTALGPLQSCRAPLDLAYPTWSDDVAAAPTDCKQAKSPKSTRNSFDCQSM